MMPIASLLVPLDGSLQAAHSLSCATWLAKSLGPKLHILSATSHARPAREELARLRVPEACWHLIILHQAPQFPEDAILDVAAEHHVNMIIMSTQGQTAERTLPRQAPQQAPSMPAIGHVTHAVLERSTVPVLLLPSTYHEVLPWKHVLVPMSGEAEEDEVLTTAVTLANTLALDVHVIHVLERLAREHGLANAARYSDAMHYEYPQRLAELVRRTLPNCAPNECRCVKDIALARGDVTMELREQIAQKKIGLLIAGWHGCLTTRRAEVIKKLLPTVTCPVLLIKCPRRERVRLRIGLELA
jgi:nucleotide-binding universal stress UspA family protein